MNRCRFVPALVAVALLLPSFTLEAGEAAKEPSPPDLWTLAREKSDTYRYSTLFTAQNVRDDLGTTQGIEQAIQWCRDTAVTKVYIEVFRDGYTADRDTLIRARERFRAEDFIVHGCVTTTRVGKPSTDWNSISCYTDEKTQQRVEEIFRYAAELFDVIMIDDFWFTDCQCEECQKAKGDRDWATYRLELMDRVSRERVIGPAREVNPDVKLIIKFPEWYDRFHERGYDVVEETKMFDYTWIGTETRDPDNERWGKKPQYGAYWLARWADAFSHGKLGGGWFDPYGTHEDTYVEQARQTILGLCPESMLFCYGGLQRGTGPDNVAKLRRELPGLFELAAFVKGETPQGVGTYKPPHSPAGPDMYIFNFIGMLGIPMTADIAFPEQAHSLFLTYHALADPALDDALTTAVNERTPILMTSSLREALPEPLRKNLSRPYVWVLDFEKDESEASFYGVLDAVRNLLDMSRDKADAFRKPLLQPLDVELSAPTRVSLYLYGRDKAVLENFNDEAATVSLQVKGVKTYTSVVQLPMDIEVAIETKDGAAALELPPRSLVAIRLD